MKNPREMSRTEWLYGKHLDKRLSGHISVASNLAISGLQKNLQEVVLTEGLGSRSDDIYEALNWWNKIKKDFS